MMELYEHNKKAYEAVREGFKVKDRVAVVHATGTGKSYVIARVAEDYKKVLVIAPNIFVLEETKKVCREDVEFRTYASVMCCTSFEKDYDLIVLDEFHRSGAEKWGEGVQRLLDFNPTAKVLGTSATHIRYLDGQRNMADEIFDGNIVSHLPLKDAIDQGILPNPTYVASLYSVDEEVKKRRAMIQGSKKDKEYKEEQIRRLEGIASNWENSHGVPQIIRKYFDRDMKRIIVFCSKVSRASKAREWLGRWLSSAGYRRIRFYNIDYTEKRLEREMRDFQEDVEEGTLKVAISVNMLNEGVHIPRVDGIIMLRSTISRIIIEQQVGRCLTANNLGRNPVILDLVNNMDLIRYDVMPEFGEFNPHKGSGASEGNGRKFPFTVIDECRDIRVFMEQMDDEFSRNWTYEKILEEANKYETRTAFAKGSKSAYCAALRLHIIDEVCSHMKVRQSWTYEEILEEAKKYETRKAFAKGSGGAYCAARKRGILDEVCSHMKVRQSWTYEKIVEEAKKYETKIAFVKGSGGAYCAARKRGILDEVCSHMKELFWTYEKIVEEAKKYETRNAFQKGSGGAYCAALRLHIIDEVCSHMKVLRKLWTYEEILEEAKKYETRRDFAKGSGGAYCTAKQRGILDEVCSHMKELCHSWTYEEILEEAKKYETRVAFAKGSGDAYAAARRLHVLDEVCSHMKRK